MKVEWFYEAQREFWNCLQYYRENVGAVYAKKFSDKILHTVRLLEDFPEMGVSRKENLIGKYGLCALFIEQYVCIYKIQNGVVYIRHFMDARKNYMHHIFGANSLE